MKTAVCRVIFCLLGLAEPGWAAKSNYDQLSWCDGPIVYSIDVSAVEPTGDNPQTIALGIRAAMARWNLALGIDLFQERPWSGSPGVAGNGLQEIYFRDEVGLRQFFATAALQRKQQRKLVEGDIKFLPGHPWFYYHGPLRYEPSGERIPDIYRVALHEMGHVLGLYHPRLETDETVVRSHMSDIDDLTKEDLRDARLIAAVLFEKNPPRVTSPKPARVSTNASSFLLHGKGRPVFTPTMTIHLISSAGVRLRHVRLSESWSRKILLTPGLNRLRFSYRGVDRARIRFATKVIDAR